MSYAEGLHSDDYCHMEGHIYADPDSPDPSARAAAHHGTAPSTCSRCGEQNYQLRAFLGRETREMKKRGMARSELRAWAEAIDDDTPGSGSVAQGQPMTLRHAVKETITELEGLAVDSHNDESLTARTRVVKADAFALTIERLRVLLEKYPEGETK